MFSELIQQKLGGKVVSDHKVDEVDEILSGPTRFNRSDPW